MPKPKDELWPRLRLVKGSTKGLWTLCWFRNATLGWAPILIDLTDDELRHLRDMIEEKVQS